MGLFPAGSRSIRNPSTDTLSSFASFFVSLQFWQRRTMKPRPSQPRGGRGETRPAGPWNLCGRAFSAAHSIFPKRPIRMILHPSASITSVTSLVPIKQLGPRLLSRQAGERFFSIGFRFSVFSYDDIARISENRCYSALSTSSYLFSLGNRSRFSALYRFGDVQPLSRCFSFTYCHFLCWGTKNWGSSIP